MQVTCHSLFRWEVYSLVLAVFPPPLILEGAKGCPCHLFHDWKSGLLLSPLPETLLSFSLHCQQAGSRRAHRAYPWRKRAEVIETGDFFSPVILRALWITPFVVPLPNTCVLSLFSCVWLFATLWTVAHQAPLSMGFSRQESWSGWPCPLQGIFQTQRSNPSSPHLLRWQAGSLPPAPPANHVGLVLICCVSTLNTILFLLSWNISHLDIRIFSKSTFCLRIVSVDMVSSNVLVSYLTSLQVSQFHTREEKKNLPLYNIDTQVNSSKSGQEYKVRNGPRTGEGDLHPNKKNGSSLASSGPSCRQHSRLRWAGRALQERLQPLGPGIWVGRRPQQT